MRHTLASFIFLIAILLAGCGPANGNPTPADNTAPVKISTATGVPVKMECQIVSLSPTPGPTEASMFPPVQADDWIRGSANPSLTILEYSDFQCPYCSLLAADLDMLIQKHPDEVQVVFRHFPLPTHPLSKLGAYASEAAGAQGKFWEMHDRLFASQETTAPMDETQFRAWLVEQAQDLNLDADQFSKDLNSQAIIDKIEKAQQYGLNIQIPGTPLVLINGNPYQGPRDVASFEAILNLFQLESKQFTACPPMLVDPQKQYIATIETEKGKVVLQLFADKAPMAVNSFVFLAQQGWFDGITFHRVMPGFVVQSGDPSGSGMGGPGYYFSNETNDLKYDKPGMVGMANAGQDSNGSQFFITFKALPDLDGQYTVFGEVIEGMEALEKLTARDPSQQMDLPPGDKIIRITVKEK